MKNYTNIELQSKLNGYLMNLAGLLFELEDEIKLSLLKKLSSDFIIDIKKLGATEKHVDKAMFFTCNNFDINVDA